MKKNNLKVMQNLALVSQIGFMMITPIILMVFLGNWIVNSLNLPKILILVFILLGIGASFMNFYKLAVKKSKEKDDDRA